MFNKLASAAFAAALALATLAPSAHAQKALVYCPVGVDAAGCDRVVAALQSKFADGVDRGYDGSAGTVDLNKADLNHYGVVVVPSLADNADKQPYAVLRAAAARLRLAINGRVAVYSGAPDQGSANRTDKDALIQNLAQWAAKGHTRGTSLVGLVAFLDLSDNESDRYAWVKNVSLVDVSADAELQAFPEVSTVSPRGGKLLSNGGKALRFANMASYGLHIGGRAAARTEVGATGGASGAQSVLVTYANADGSDLDDSGLSTGKVGSSGASFNMTPGNSASLSSSASTPGATLTTDKSDYQPGEIVTFTGTGWGANDTVTITIHEDPQWSNPDRTVTAVADGSGNFSSHTFVLEQRDYGVAFAATAVGNPSGFVAQATFTDGNKISFSSTRLGAEETTWLGNPVGSGVCTAIWIQERQGGNIDSTHAARTVALSSSQPGLTLHATSACGATISSIVIANNSPATQFFFRATVNATITGDAADLSSSNDASTAVTVANPINTAPSFTKGADQTKLEDAGPQSVPGWATAISKGPPSESGQTVNFIVSNNNNSLFSTQPAVDASGQLTYTPAPNANGSATVTVQIHDDGGTANGGVDTSPAQTFSITITAVNDAPSFTKGANDTKLEDAGAQTVVGWATAISAGPTDEAAQTLSFTVTNDNNALFSVQPALAANGTLTYTLAADANGLATVTVTLKDDGGTANGGVDASAPQTFTITVTPVNDAPSFTKGADQTVNEDAGAQTVTPWATAISAGPNEASQIVDFVVNNNNNVLFSVQPTVSATGTLTYTPAPNANGSATVTIHIHDNGGTANGGVDFSADQTFTITVNPVNDAPSFTKGANETKLEDAGAQTVVGWATAISAGPADEAAQTLGFMVTNDNNGLFTVQPAIAPNGTLTYTLAADANGLATVTVTLKDNGGTANGGVDTSGPQTFTITVTPVNDAPSFTKGADQTKLEDAGPQTVAGWATAISKGPPNESGQTVNFIVSNNNNSVFSAQPAVDAAGQLTYTPAANANGSATVTIQIHDDGGALNGGVDTSPAQTFTITITAVNDAPSFTKGADQTVPEDAEAQTVANWATSISAGPADEVGQTLTFGVSNDNNALFSVQPAIAPNGTLTYTLAANANGSAIVTVQLMDNGGTANGGVDTSAPQTFTITVNSVNDAPSFTKGADQTKLEDAGPQTVAGWATGISTGPANESSQTVSFNVTGNTNAALFSAGPAVAANGTLTYTPAADAFGTATITIVAHDNGGTANGGVDTSAPQTFTITITPVNDAPTFGLIASHTVLEDAGAQSVASALTNPSAGPANESGQTLTLTVTNDNNALFSAQPAIDASGTLTYTPAANAYGSATVTVKLMDNGGTADGGVDVTTKTLTITVTPVNDAPSFTKGADQTVNEDAGAQTVTPWATAISAGPNEAAQTVDFVISNNNNALFSVQPAVSATGTLTYTPAPNANGSATVTIHIHDNGGTDNGGVDHSADQTFAINVTAVNDAPSFTKGANETKLEDAGAQTVAGWATAISAGPADEAAQTLSFLVSNDNNALFSVQPAIAPNGTLTYTLAADANGLATVTVKLMDNGGTANGGVDTSAPQYFTITVTPVNDAPSFTKGANQTSLEDAGAQTVNGWASAISAGPNEAAQSVDFMVTNDNNGLFAVQPTIDPSGKLTYTAAPNANGSATVTVKLHDDGGTANGGVNVSGNQIFTITITAVNDAPLYTLITTTTSAEDAGPQTVANALTGASPGGGSDESSQTLSITTMNNNNALFSTQPSIDLTTGALTYTAAPNANGSATVMVTLKDNGGMANGGVDATTKMLTITVTKVNDAPVITDFSSPLVPNAVNTAVSASGAFKDFDLGDSPPDTHTGSTINWGDGVTTGVNIASGSGVTRNFSGSHSYSAPGVYTIVAYIKDAAGAVDDSTYQYVVVYDPSAGFVTGGGWITSPVGAYAASPSLTGKATFGFESKYKKGQSVPDGNTEFQFHAAGMNFKSTSYEWLVIAGSKAQFKGSGTINGSGDYFFMLTGTDGDLKSKGSPDTFRMKIWNKTTLAVIYDNQIGSVDTADTADPTTVLGGGKIQIHDK